SSSTAGSSTAPDTGQAGSRRADRERWLPMAFSARPRAPPRADARCCAAMRRIVGLVAVAVVAVALVAGVRWVRVGAQVGAGFAAKVTCSLVHLAGLDARHVV